MHFTAAGNEWMRLTVAWISVRTAAEKVLHVQKDKKNTKVLSDKTCRT